MSSTGSRDSCSRDVEVPDRRRHRKARPSCSCRSLASRPLRDARSGGRRRSRSRRSSSIAAQRAITEMRKRVQAHVLRLPISYFDSTKTGVLISRIMTDAEGVRNLVGTGLVQLVGSIITAVHRARRPVLPELEADERSRSSCWSSFGGMMTIAFKRAAPAVPRARRDQRRGHRPARRDARRHPAREGLRRRAARATRLRARRAQAVPQRREDDHRHVGRRRGHGGHHRRRSAC